MKKIILIWLGVLVCAQLASAQRSEPVLLSTLDAFESPGKNWVSVSDVGMDLYKPSAKLKEGKGILVSKPSKEASDLVSNTQLEGNFEITLDFMTSKGSSSAIYLMGRYKIQLSDSWPAMGKPLAEMGIVDIGAFEKNSSFRIQQPLSNVTKAPGLWQHLKVKFKAPTFDRSGKKLQEASFEEIYLNGVLVHQGVLLEGPSGNAMFNDEKTQGPFVIKADKNHTIAFRNITYQVLPEMVLSESSAGSTPRRYFRVVNPILLNPGSEPYLLRSYLAFGDKKRTHAISVGNPNQTNYSYDLKQGALLQIWRGPFADVTGMWESRGEPQLAMPLGAVTGLSMAPSFAILDDPNSAWPDSIPFEQLHNKGYSLDKSKNPTFHYEYSGFNVDDKISTVENGESLKREVNVSNAPDNLYFRVASGKSVEPMGNGLYLIDGKSYYIKIDERLKPTIRTSHEVEELLVAFKKGLSSLDYSIIF
jgi:hypothetical protein